MKLIDDMKDLLPVTVGDEKDLRKVAADAAQLDYEIVQLEEEMDAKKAKVAEEYGGRIATLKKNFDRLFKGLKGWAGNHREAFGKRQSYLVDGHALTFRQSPGKVVSDEKDAELVDRILATGDRDLIAATVRVEPALDKLTVRAHIEEGSEIGKRLVEEFGVRVVKPESFNFSPARTGDDS